MATNAREIEIAAFREAQQKELQALEHQRVDLLIDVYTDLPTDDRPVAAEMLAKRLKAADESSRSEAVDRPFPTAGGCSSADLLRVQPGGEDRVHPSPE
jgi:hypothetical protein